MSRMQGRASQCHATNREFRISAAGLDSLRSSHRQRADSARRDRGVGPRSTPAGASWQAEACKHERSSGRPSCVAAGVAQPQLRDRRTRAWPLSPAYGNSEPAWAADAKGHRSASTRPCPSDVESGHRRWRPLPRALVRFRSRSDVQLAMYGRSFRRRAEGRGSRPRRPALGSVDDVCVERYRAAVDQDRPGDHARGRRAGGAGAPAHGQAHIRAALHGVGLRPEARTARHNTTR